jgi:hypothetical protein
MFDIHDEIVSKLGIHYIIVGINWIDNEYIYTLRNAVSFNGRFVTLQESEIRLAEDPVELPKL